jgi:hypothetical protein
MRVGGICGCGSGVGWEWLAAAAGAQALCGFPEVLSSPNTPAEQWVGLAGGEAAGLFGAFVADGGGFVVSLCALFVGFAGDGVVPEVAFVFACGVGEVGAEDE